MRADSPVIGSEDASPLADEVLPMTGPGGLGSAGDGGSAETGPTSLRVRAEHGKQDRMVEETSGQAKAGRKPKGRKFYRMDADYNRGGLAGFRLENEDTIMRHLYRPRADPQYSELPEQPRFLFDKKLGRPPRDIEGYVGHWLVSDRMKAVLEEVDRDAFAFASCDVRLPDGSAGPHRWLCTVTRVLDALDEGASELKIGQDQGQKVYLGWSRLIFREDVIGPAHVFRTPLMMSKIICDQAMKDACRQADLKGVDFGGVVKK